ncbi:hypothetical protein [Vibrio hangzhouensis]|uniref:hypothetical protein n=1 Tax=Vibrio hangzhouensis TaxID=462991 RepID=UPI001C9428BC|nr:hypothetical protein [Vibrio hangzhouensis]MBY6196082.1 hypothetical protein [Vibrio hangzhouensis]
MGAIQKIKVVTAIALVGAGGFAVMEFKNKQDRKERQAQASAFTDAMNGSYFVSGDDYFHLRLGQSSSSWKVSKIGWCGEEQVLREHMWTSDVMDSYNGDTGSIIINGKELTQTFEDIFAKFKVRDEGTISEDSDTWKAYGTRMSGPSYSVCEYSKPIYSGNERPSKVKVRAGAKIVALEDSGHALFPYIEVGESVTAFSNPFSSGETRIKLNGIYKPMQVENIGGMSRVSVHRVGEANELIKLLLSSNHMTLDKYQISGKGFTKAINELRASNPDLITWGLLRY